MSAIKNRSGMSLVEVSIASLVGLGILAAMQAGMLGISKQANLTASKSSLGTNFTTIGQFYANSTNCTNMFKGVPFSAESAQSIGVVGLYKENRSYPSSQDSDFAMTFLKVGAASQGFIPSEIKLVKAPDVTPSAVPSTTPPQNDVTAYLQVSGHYVSGSQNDSLISSRDITLNLRYKADGSGIVSCNTYRYNGSTSGAGGGTYSAAQACTDLFGGVMQTVNGKSFCVPTLITFNTSNSGDRDVPCSVDNVGSLRKDAINGLMACVKTTSTPSWQKIKTTPSLAEICTANNGTMVDRNGNPNGNAAIDNNYSLICKFSDPSSCRGGLISYNSWTSTSQNCTAASTCWDVCSGSHNWGNIDPASEYRCGSCAGAQCRGSTITGIGCVLP